MTKMSKLKEYSDTFETLSKSIVKYLLRDVDTEIVQTKSKKDGGYDIIAERGLYSYAVGRDGQGQRKYDHSDYCGETPWAEFFKEYIEK